MKSEQIIWQSKSGWSKESSDLSNATLVFVFGDGEYFMSDECLEKIRSFYPSAQIVGCSTCGNIAKESIIDNGVVVTAVDIDKKWVKVVVKDIETPSDSAKVGTQIANELQDEELKHIFILSDGLNVNGSMLVDAVNLVFGGLIPVSGGLAGDGTKFENSYVIANDNPKRNRLVAVGFYGDKIEIKTGCESGWDEFGALRLVTKSEGNVVYEIDNQPALELYKKYLGEDIAKDLPGSGLRFPINIKALNAQSSVIRTLLAINEEQNSLTFAGDVPQGYNCRLMKSNIDKLIENSEIAAKNASVGNLKNGISIAISCVGRRLVLGQLTEEELEAAARALGQNVVIAGFYSYGEIAPFDGFKNCELHNQTMTITTIYEK